MNKISKNIFARLTRLIFTHPWLKLISLLLAAIVWFYVKKGRI
jgi:hypothetical protein